MPKYSVKRPFTVLVAVILVLVLGAVSLMNMTTDLLPTMSLPYAVVVTTYPGASPEKVESELTRPLESSLGTVNGVENVTSTSSENYSTVMLEFAEGTNMDSAMVKISTELNQLADSLPDQAGTPIVMEISADMMATEYVAVDVDGMDIYQLSDYVKEQVIPELERVNGVASVSSVGLVEQMVEVRLNQAMIDEVNDKLLVQVSDKLADAKKELDDARRELANGEKELSDGQAALDSGKAELASGKQELADQQAATADQLAGASQQLDEAVAKVTALTTQLEMVQALQKSLNEQLNKVDTAQIDQSYRQLDGMIASLKAAHPELSYGSLAELAAGGAQGYEAYRKQIWDLTAQNPADQLLQGACTVFWGVPYAPPQPPVPGEGGGEGGTTPGTDSGEGTDPSGNPSGGAGEGTDPGGNPSGTGAGEGTDPGGNPSGTGAGEGAGEGTDPGGDPSGDPPADPTVPAQLPYPDGTQGMTYEQLSGLHTTYQTIQTVKQQLDGVNAQLSQLTAAKEAAEKNMGALREAYKALEAGKINAAAGFGSGSAQLAAGEAALGSAQAQLDAGKEQLKTGREQLDDAYKQYEEARKEALKNANLDQLLNMQTLAQLIGAQNFSMPAGYIQNGDEQYLLKVGDTFGSVEELSGALLCHVDGIGDVRISDVATVTLIDNSGESYARADGNQAVLLSVFKGSTAGTSAVSDACNERMAELMAQNPALHMTPIMDQGDYIRLIVNSVVSNLLQGAVLAILVLALFLKDYRPTLVVAASIPLSVLFAIVLMYFTGITLNMISLSGLALGIGMLVDNSIVVIENIYRLRTAGVPAPRAAVQGARQMSGAIIASTATTICVFLPLVFTDGLTRELMGDMALTIGYSLVASLIVALTVVPASGSTLLRTARPKKHAWFDRVIAAYGRLLSFCLRVKVAPLALSVVLLGVSVWRLATMGLVLLPEMSSNQLSFTVTVPEDTEPQDAFAVADEIMARVQALPGVSSVGAMSGNAAGAMAGLTGAGGDDLTSFSYYVLLTDEGSSRQSSIRQQLEQAADGLDCELSVAAGGAADMSALMGSGIAVNVYSNDLDDLMEATGQIMEALAGVDGIADVSNGQEDGAPEVRVVVDKDKAMRLGLTVAQVYAELAQALTTESTSTTLTVGADTYTVEIVDETRTPDLDSIFGYEFETTTTDEDGNQVKETHTLGEFATRRNAAGLASISRENQARYMTVTSSTLAGYNTTLLSREVKGVLEGLTLPEGCTWELTGESTQVDEMVGQMAQMLALALTFVYLVMVAQFQSLLSPFIVLFTVPLAFTGGMLALILTGEQLSMMSLMGFLVLMGVVVNNGIVFVDYANQLRIGGMGRRAALIATGKTRMRPILMTTLTTVLAMVTMLFSTDAGSEMGRGMAIVIIGGLSYATLMTLFIVPVMYDLLFRKQPTDVDVGDDGMDDLPDDAAGFLAELAAQDARSEGAVADGADFPRKKEGGNAQQ